MQLSRHTSRAQRQVHGTLTLPDVGGRQVRHLVRDYLAKCRENHLFEVTIVHGVKGRLRTRTIHKVLTEMPEVACFRSNGASEETGGSTVVVLLGPDEFPLRQHSFHAERVRTP